MKDNGTDSGWVLVILGVWVIMWSIVLFFAIFVK
jgi:hypothetical protein